MANVTAKKNKQKWTEKEEFSRIVEAGLKSTALIKSMEDFDDGRTRKSRKQSLRLSRWRPASHRSRSRYRSAWFPGVGVRA